MDVKLSFWERWKRTMMQALIDISFETAIYVGSKYTYIEADDLMLRSYVEYGQASLGQRRNAANYTTSNVSSMTLLQLRRWHKKMKAAVMEQDRKNVLYGKVEGLALSQARSEAFVNVLRVGGEDSPWMAKIAACEDADAVIRMGERAVNNILVQQREEEERLEREERSAYLLARAAKAKKIGA